MSTLAYAQLTKKREDAPPGTSNATGIQRYVDVLAALVPVEVLTAHAAVLSFTTVTQKNQQGELVTTITQPGTLRGVFIALLLLCILLYAVGHRTHWDRFDFARMLIPPLAFVGWMMLQKATAFDALVPNLGSANREAIAVIGAIFLAVLATLLANQANQKNSASSPSAAAVGGQ